MNSEILCVGTELLLGDVVNTNAAFIARELAACGIGCYYQSVVGDNPQRLKDCLALALSRSDLVITTGGLGPTYDDLTKETVAAYFGRKMELHEASLQRLTDLFARQKRSMSPNNVKQAYMPEGAHVFVNERGTAPGLALEDQGKCVIMLPGPPREVNPMFENHVRPYLLARSNSILLSHTVHLFGIGESDVENKLKDYMESHNNPTIAPYAKDGEVMLRVTAKAHNKEEAETMIEPVLKELEQRCSPYVYGIDSGGLENALVLALLEKKLSIAVLENYSGGLLSSLINEAGLARDVFKCGISVGSPDLLARFLDMPALDACESVSERTVLDMARRLRELYAADIGCVVSGKVEEYQQIKPADEGWSPVCIAVSSAGLEKIESMDPTRRYGGDWKFFRRLTVLRALRMSLDATRV